MDKENAKMFKVRPMQPGYQNLYRLQYSATNDDIPLKENWSERWTTLLVDFEACMERLLQLEVRPEDVFVSTFMKCGTTWMQEAVWLLLNNLDFETAKKIGLAERSTFVDLAGLYKNVGDPIETCKKMPNPRIIKTHLPANLMPHQVWEKKPKIIYVARNTKDVVVSSYHFVKGMGYWSGSIDDFVEEFLHDAVMYTPYWPHTLEFWQMRHEPNIFFVTYEEMKRDLSALLQKLCKFLDRPQLNEAEMKQILEHLSFKNMKENKSTNLTHFLKDCLNANTTREFKFMRRGVVGAYKEDLTPELQQKIDEWTHKYLEKYDITEKDIFGEFENDCI